MKRETALGTLNVELHNNALKQGDRFTDALAIEFVNQTFPRMLGGKTPSLTIQPAIPTLVPSSATQWFHFDFGCLQQATLTPPGHYALCLSIPLRSSQEDGHL